MTLNLVNINIDAQGNGIYLRGEEESLHEVSGQVAGHSAHTGGQHQHSAVLGPVRVQRALGQVEASPGQVQLLHALPDLLRADDGLSNLRYICINIGDMGILIHRRGIRTYE